MADLTGYTAMTDVHGGASASLLVKKYMEIVTKTLVGSTKVIQRVGDQIVLLADEPNDIIETAKALTSIAHSEHHFLSIHAGIHYGSVFIEKDSLFGSTINITSRIMNVASHGQVLCSGELIERIDSTRHLNKYLGEFSFKNVLKAVSLYELQIEGPDLHPIDPVCRMQVDPDKASHVQYYQGKSYHFCSEHCQLLFLQQPNSFL